MATDNACSTPDSRSARRTNSPEDDISDLRLAHHPRNAFHTALLVTSQSQVCRVRASPGSRLIRHSATFSRRRVWEQDPLWADDTSRVLKTCKEFAQLRDEAISRLYYNTGARLSEIGWADMSRSRAFGEQHVIDVLVVHRLLFLSSRGT